MAHRTDTFQVPREFPTPGSSADKVKDPACGKELTRKEARSILFLPEGNVYFCSRECLEKFRVARRKPAAA